MPSEFVIEGLKQLRELGENYSMARVLIHDLIMRASNKFAGESARISKQKYLSGGSDDVLKVRTGRLRSSIRPGVRSDGGDVIISLGTGVPYGAIHEYGGAIMRGGKSSGQMPERSFLRRAFQDTLDPFKRDIETLMMGAAHGGFSRG